MASADQQQLMITKENPSFKQNFGYGGGGGRPGGDCSFKKIQNYIFNFGDLLGQGNFSKVYKGHNEITNEVVAIKIVELNSLKSKKLEELLFSEIEILKKISHPNILKCHEVFTSNRNCYIITELCNEGDLQSKLKGRKSLKEDEVAPYIKAVHKGLVYLSDHGVVHRDIKVSNIFIHNGQAKIADFGFAKATRTKFKDINIGSPIYMSPEGLIENIYGPKTDIWAFGILIFELLHGKTPYSHCKSESELKYNISVPVGWNQLKAELSTNIKEIILKCLEIDEPTRVSASQLSNLAYFRKPVDSSFKGTDSPFKPHQNASSSLSSGSLGNFSLSVGIGGSGSEPFVYRSDGDQVEAKYRIKTENENQFRKVSRQHSTGLSFGQSKDKYSFSKDNTPHHNYMVQADKANGKHSISSSNFTGSFDRALNVPLRKVVSDKRTDAVLSAKLTFRECVNILHYCRLLFKHLVHMRDLAFGDQNQRSIFKRWLSTILKSLMREVDQKRVICQGDNVAARQRKLQQVTGEYVKKYSRELNLDLSKIRLEESAIINYEKICNYFVSVQQLIDQLVAKDPSSASLLQLGHSMVVIVQSTRVLKRCYESENYALIEKLKEIEEFLGMKKENLDFSSYQWYKKKHL